ncbi:MAG: choice-of-anchor B family protein [Woeseiaceae bacterium]|nr:choice-of-anchor B family protein [Woeseiaceae bacterium]
MLRLSFTASLAALLLGLSGAAFADTEEPPLNVAPSGTDTGNCLDKPCRSLDYALRRVGKNGRISVAAGNYELSDPGDIFYLVSGAIEVNADAGAVLIGVPHEFAGDLAAQGFRTIADSKGLDRDTVAALAKTRNTLQSNTAATACAGGFADIFPCDNVDLLAHVSDRTPSARGADIWGFIDLNTHREYAIMGYSRGTAVYDVTDPENPLEVGFVDGQSTTWRDIKVYQFWNSSDSRWNAYAYITADNANDGLFIVDLTDLPHRISRVNYTSDFTAAHNVYLSRTDFSTGLSLTGESPILILAGSNRDDGRFRSYSLNNARAPSFIARPGTPAGQPGSDRLYMHDAASMLVTDSRKDSQCVNASASAYCDVLFDFNESTLDIWDITDPANPVRLSRTPYGNAGYSHSGWWSEDQQYVFLQDELDERDRGLVTTLRAFSISDLRNPTLAGSWTGPTTAIDHNGFVRGNRYYMSNYARGLTILDITNPASPTQAGRFDSYPTGDGVGFPGAWGTYPYLPSGNILISDIDSGLYVVDDRTRTVPQGTLSFAAASFGADEGTPGSSRITIRRTDGSQGATSVAWEVVPATADASDVVLASGTLNWGIGDAADKSIDLGLVPDGQTEGLERLIVRLSAPTNGATLSSPTIASLYISDAGATSTVGFADSGIAAPERGFGKAIAVVRRGGSAIGAVSVDFAVTAGDASSGSDYSGASTGTLSWADGDADPQWIEFDIADDGASESDEFFQLTLSNVSGASLANSQIRIDILDGTGTNAAPNAVAGASQQVTGGTVVTLNGSGSNDPDGDTLTYSWSQTLGPAVTLSDTSVAQPTFTAPTVSSDTLLQFQLTVSDPNGLVDSATASVTVATNAPAPSGGGGGALSLWLLTLLLFERVRFYDRLFAIRSR